MVDEGKAFGYSPLQLPRHIGKFASILRGLNAVSWTSWLWNRKDTQAAVLLWWMSCYGYLFNLHGIL